MEVSGVPDFHLTSGHSIICSLLEVSFPSVAIYLSPLTHSALPEYYFLKI